MSNVCENGIIRAMTGAEEVDLIAERRRPLTPEETADLLLRGQVQSIRVDDQTALRLTTYYPDWSDLIGQVVERKDGEEFRFVYSGKLFKLIPLTHTFQAHWEPGVGTESLYVRIVEEHDGSRYDPIPYEGNMTLLDGLYYLQGGVVYPCIRDAEIPVHDLLSALVGVYVGEGIVWEPLL